jgi:hypothetical protein
MQHSYKNCGGGGGVKVFIVLSETSDNKLNVCFQWKCSAMIPVFHNPISVEIPPLQNCISTALIAVILGGHIFGKSKAPSPPYACYLNWFTLYLLWVNLNQTRAIDVGYAIYTLTQMTDNL